MNSFQINKMDDEIQRGLDAIAALSGEKITIKTVTVVECETPKMAEVLKNLMGRLLVEAPAPTPKAMLATPGKKSAWQQTPREKKCEICGETFIAARASTRYCGREDCRTEIKRRYNASYNARKEGQPAGAAPLAVEQDEE